MERISIVASFEINVVSLKINTHPNADALELAQVGGYNAVVRKGEFVDGQLAVYIPEQAIVPDVLLEELGLVGKLAGANHDRVKAIRLRGAVSQGIVFTPVGWTQTMLQEHIDDDLSETFNIVKWAPEIPPAFSGIRVAAPDIVPMTEIENIKRFPDMFTPGEPVFVTEKLHGTCTIVSYILEQDELFVSSKGIAKQHASLAHSDKNIYWRSAQSFDLQNILHSLALELKATQVTLYGETFGTGIQDLQYGANARSEQPGFAAFDLHVIPAGNGFPYYVDAQDLDRVFAGRIPLVPLLFQGEYSFNDIVALSSGRETVSGNASHIREGCVVRPAMERYKNLEGRVIAKFISNEYLFRKGGTELD